MAVLIASNLRKEFAGSVLFDGVSSVGEPVVPPRAPSFAPSVVLTAAPAPAGHSPAPPTRDFLRAGLEEIR